MLILYLLGVIILIKIIKSVLISSIERDYGNRFKQFQKQYMYFDDNTLMQWKKGLEEDFGFDDMNPYNLQMLLMIEDEIEKRKK